MKTNSALAGYRRSRRTQVNVGVWRFGLMLCPLICGLGALPSARADLSAPDNVLYGRIVLGTNQVSAGDKDVVVEARRANGLPIARYRMGDSSDVGDFYKLNIKMEEVAPLRDTQAVLPGEVLALVVMSGGMVRTQESFQVMERGQALRLDFGVLNTNGPLTGYNAWAAGFGFDSDSRTLDADGDGIPNYDEYVAGTDPTKSDSKFVLQIGVGPANSLVSFQALRAEGAGYEGCARHYALEQRDELGSGSWEAVPGYSDLVGANQAVSYTLPATDGPVFFRGRVWLEGSQGQRR